MLDIKLIISYHKLKHSWCSKFLLNPIMLLQLVIFGMINSCLGVDARVIDNLCIDISNSDACQQIDRDQQIKCKYTSTKTDCLLDIEKGSRTLSLITPEIAFLAAGLVSENVVVIGEVIAENAPFETVVIVKSSHTGGFGDSLKGLKYCHPGYNHDERITRYVLEEFDWKNINITCGNDTTLTEQKFKAMADFYGSSCRPGKWTEDTTLDAYLKNQYPSLCELCGLSGCSVRYDAPLNATLECLLNNGGDIALTDRQYAAALFESEALNPLDYLYLCPNGTVSQSVCTWTRQLGRLIVADSNSASVMVEYLREKLPTYITTIDAAEGSDQYLVAVLPLSRSDIINLVDSVPLRTYVSGLRPVPGWTQENSTCDPIRWSVTNELEQNKCLWLKQAGLTHGLLPNISCVTSTDNDTVSNLSNLQNDVADIAFIDASFGYVARRKNLSNVAYTETLTSQLSRIVIVVKNNTSWYSNLTDLRGRSVCLPQYGGKEWLAYVDLLRSNGLVDDSTNYGLIFSNFVGESCAPGANSNEIDIPDTDSTKLCSRCYPINDTTTAKYCNADELNKYYGSNGALRCLDDENADYAVIDLNDLSRRFSRPENSETFRIISRNGSLASYTGFNVDEAAPIVIIVAGEVVTRNVSVARYNDTVLFLRSMELEFGQNLDKAFKVFETFNETKDLLFPDSTPGLTFTSVNTYILNYRQLLDNSSAVLITTSGSSYLTTVPALFVIFMLTVVIRIF